MKICVVGLGLIGGSIAMSLKRAGYTVYGMNRTPEVVDYALENNIIDYGVPDYDDERVTAEFDVVFVALPLDAATDFICNRKFRRGAIVSDICGVKRSIEKAVFSAPRQFLYVGLHPMAGKEVSTIKNASANLFDGASMVITSNDRTSLIAVAQMEKFAREMGFGYIAECSAAVHDEKIAYTSQLAHIVSNCYVKDSAIESCETFTGGSFQDMTRIADVDQKMWSELYLANADNLSGRITELIKNLTLVNEAIKSGDKQNLVEVLQEGSCRVNLSELLPEQGMKIICLI